MSFTTVETQITWSAAEFIALSNATPTDSDVFTFHADTIAASIQINANTADTPAAGDTLTARVKWTSGDILGDTGDDYDTNQHAEFVGLLDCVAANTPGENPARRTYHLNVAGANKLRLSVVAAQGNSRAVTVRARIIERRGV
jgi:hypothetical protein